MDVLLVEDEESSAKYVQRVLRHENFDVSLKNLASSSLNKNFIHLFDLVLFNMHTYNTNSSTFIGTLKNNFPYLPIIIISNNPDANIKIELFNLGIEDYIMEPFNKFELIARIKTVLRRYLTNKSKTNIQYGSLIFNLKTRVLKIDKRVVYLTKTEAMVFKLLVLNANRIVSISDLLIKVWNMNPGYHSNIVEVTINRLRKKIDERNKRKLIKNIHGSGYFLDLSKQ